MKRRMQYCALAAEALLCIVIICVGLTAQLPLAAMLSFPFAQIGAALRALSLSGFAGNLLAIVLYLAIGALPFVGFLCKKRRTLYPEDALLALLSVTLLVVLYQMINPGAISLVGGFSEGFPVAKAVMGGSIYSLIIGHQVLRALRRFFLSNTAGLHRSLSSLLFLLNMLFVLVIFGGGIHGTLQSIEAMQLANSGATHLFSYNYFFIWLGFVVDNLPYACNISIIFSAISLLEQLQLEHHTERTVLCAGQLSQRCVASLFVVVFGNALFHMLQLLFSAHLFSINASVNVPLFSIIFVFICLFITNLLDENKTLKDENDSII